MFTLAISCLTTSNLPRFMDLTSQVLTQYCSLEHQTLLPSLVTYIVGYCFHFGSASSFFLELFLHSSPVAYWASTDLGISWFSVISFCLFIVFLGFSDSSVGKESASIVGDPGSIPGLGRSPGEGISTHTSVLGLPLWLSW